jgi:large conductance mechanosensitive channel
MNDFIQFLREQGVVGFAVGFILGGAVSTVVQSLVRDIINPLIGMFMTGDSALSTAVISVNGAEIAWGNFVTVFINFVVVALVVYVGVKVLKADRLDSAT